MFGCEPYLFDATVCRVAMEGDQRSLLFPGVHDRALHIVDTNGVVAVAGKCGWQMFQSATAIHRCLPGTQHFVLCWFIV